MIVVDAIARLDDEDLPALTASPAFRRGMERCADSKDTLRLHLNVAATMLQLLGFASPEGYEPSLLA